MYNKTYKDYISYYPYLLSLKLGVINKATIKNFKDAEGHEILNEKHQKKTKKNKILNVDNIPMDDHMKAIPRHKIDEIKLPSKQDTGSFQMTAREEYKNDIPIHEYSTTDRNHHGRVKESIYASTDVRSSIDPNFTLSKRTNNYMGDEHISITHRMRNVNPQPSNNESSEYNNTPSQNKRGVIMDSEMYKVNGPRTRPVENTSEENEYYATNHLPKLATSNLDKLGHHLNKRIAMKAKNKSLKNPLNESGRKHKFELLKKIKEEEENEQVHDFLNNSNSSNKRLTDENKEESKELPLHPPSDIHNILYKPKGKHRLANPSFLTPGRRKGELSYDHMVENTAANIRLKNNFVNSSMENDSSKGTNDFISNLRPKAKYDSLLCKGRAGAQRPKTQHGTSKRIHVEQSLGSSDNN